MSLSLSLWGETWPPLHCSYNTTSSTELFCGVVSYPVPRLGTSCSWGTGSLGWQSQPSWLSQPPCGSQNFQSYYTKFTNFLQFVWLPHGQLFNRAPIPLPPTPKGGETWMGDGHPTKGVGQDHSAHCKSCPEGPNGQSFKVSNWRLSVNSVKLTILSIKLTIVTERCFIDNLTIVTELYRFIDIL